MMAMLNGPVSTFNHVMLIDEERRDEIKGNPRFISIGMISKTSHRKFLKVCLRLFFQHGT